MNRRKFLKNGTAATAGILLYPGKNAGSALPLEPNDSGKRVLLSTWDFGQKANEKGWNCLLKGKKALDAVEEGIRVIEEDPDNLSVGLGGLPDRDGYVTLDACIMNEKGRAGSVTFLRDIVHPISVARLVMEKTPHVMLSGAGALQFALENGFKRENLLTDRARKAWEEWKKTSRYEPVINIENHDTVGLLVMDIEGNLSGGCSTSGLAYKMHGRVGDSPIIGAGLYVDNKAGAAVATGLGELVMRSLASFLVVELMRNGSSPQDACELAIERIVLNNPEYGEVQVGIIALDKSGNHGAFAIQPGFTYAIRDEHRDEVLSSNSYLQ